MVFVRAGGTELWWSPECVQALLDQQFNPDNFGSYSHVASRISVAQAKCEAWDSATPAQRRGMDPPTGEDRYLAASNAGHLMQNAVAQQRRPDRGNYCDNVIDGYNSYDAPCAAMEGRQGQPGTEEDRWSTWEAIDRGQAAAPDARGQQGGYDPQLRRQHERERLQDFVEAHPARAQAYDEEARRLGGPARPTDIAPAQPTARSVPRPQQITGKDAADCIDTFLQKQEQAMYQDCASNTEPNRTLADRGSAVSQQHAARLGAQRVELEQRLSEQDRAIQQATRRGVGGQQLQQLHVDRAETTNRLRDNDRQQRAYDSADCAARQGARLRGGHGHSEGRPA